MSTFEPIIDTIVMLNKNNWKEKTLARFVYRDLWHPSANRKRTRNYQDEVKSFLFDCCITTKWVIFVSLVSLPKTPFWNASVDRFLSRFLTLSLLLSVRIKNILSGWFSVFAYFRIFTLHIIFAHCFHNDYFLFTRCFLHTFFLIRIICSRMHALICLFFFTLFVEKKKNISLVVQRYDCL